VQGRLQVTAAVSIPLEELRFTFDRSPGPGGQNVNKLSTRVEVRLAVGSTASLTQAQRERLQEALGARLTRDGQLVVRSSRYRSQARNRQDCLDKLAAILWLALQPPPPKRRPTRPTAASRRRRLEQKRQDSAQKATRRRPEA
jgi:ribosome-associated protein